MVPTFLKFFKLKKELIKLARCNIISSIQFMAKPDKKEYPEFYQTYINALKVEDTLLNHLETSLKHFEEVLSEIEFSKQEYRYAEGKWTIKEIVQHLIDTERVFVYRALRYSRKDSSSLLSFDENSFVTNYEVNKRNFDDMLNEFTLLRRSTIFMFQDFEEEILDRAGKVGDQNISVRAIGYICSGHVIHHLKVIEERYMLS